MFWNYSKSNGNNDFVSNEKNFFSPIFLCKRIWCFLIKLDKKMHFYIFWKIQVVIYFINACNLLGIFNLNYLSWTVLWMSLSIVENIFIFYFFILLYKYINNSYDKLSFSPWFIFSNKNNSFFKAKSTKI